MDAFLITAMAAIVVTAMALLVDVQQTRTIRKINRRFDKEAEAFEERGTIGEQFGDWLLAKSGDKPEDVSNLEVMTTLVGRQIAGSFSAAAKGIMSGDIRNYRRVEGAVLQGLETPETRALSELGERIGLGRDDLGILLEVLGKRGLLDKVGIGNNGHQGSNTSW